MASFGNSPNPWGSSSYDTYKDCSQGLCSIYCPQWCYLIFPPPPPMFGFENDNSSGGGENDNDTSASDFSPLIIAVIGILASAFILLSYYTLVSKYCRRPPRSDDNDNDNSPNENDNGGENENDASFSSEGVGERMIKSIKVYKYKRGDGFVDGTDCSVCLSEFEENEGLRLLPKCNHAFHAPCIDTWLKSHTSCPLCRSDIAAAAADAASVTTMTTTTAQRQLVVQGSEAVVVVMVVDVAAEESSASEEVVIGPKLRDVVPSGFGSDSGRISVADILNVGEDEDEGFDSVDRMESGVAYGFFGSVGTSAINNNHDHDDGDGDDDDDKDEERSKLGRSGTHGLLRSPLAMTRSMSSTGGFMFAKGKSSLLPN